jgi:subtilisin family serine protease
MKMGKKLCWFIISFAVAFLLPYITLDANAKKGIEIFQPSDDLVGRGMNFGQSLDNANENASFKRVIADDINESDIQLFQNRGCQIRHRLRRSASFECPQAVISDLNVREARIFHIIDLEANQQINADQVWFQGFDGTGVNVVVLDTGVDGTHIELSDSIMDCVNFVSGENCNDLSAHGTHVSGIISANGEFKNIVGNNDATGVSPGTGIYMLKVCNSGGSCYEDDMMAAMEYAVNNIADSMIMSISIGGGNFGSHCDSDPLAAKVNWVVDNGYTVVVASGNDGAGVSSPACASKAIAVGAVNKSDVLASWSNIGSALDIVAPGVSILSTYSCLASGANCGSYWYALFSGTSMATPHVAGVVALLKQLDPTLTDNQIKNALYNTAVDLGYSSQDQGNGRVDALAAFNYIATGGAPEETIEFYDEFNSQSLWSESGEGDWNIENPQEPHSGTAAHSDNCDTECILELATPINLSSKTNCTLELWRWTDDGLDNGEYLVVDFWDGSQWVQMAYWTDGDGDTDVWEFETYSLNDYLISNFSIRLRTRESSSREHVYVDGVKITCAGDSGGLTPPPPEDTDGDGSPDSTDNCPTISNPDQADIDSDGIGDACDICTDVDTDNYCAEVDDCNDDNLDINPEATEICDGVDNNCSGEIDEGSVCESPEETIEFYDSFEIGEWNGLWGEDSQNDWHRSTQRSTDGSYSAEVDGSATDATLTMTNTIDLAGKSSALLTFSWFIEGNWDNGEYICLDMYYNLAWHNGVPGTKDCIDGTSNTSLGPEENQWFHESVDLTPYTAYNDFKIRFRSRVSSYLEDGDVDNVMITGSN